MARKYRAVIRKEVWENHLDYSVVRKDLEDAVLWSGSTDSEPSLNGRGGCVYVYTRDGLGLNLIGLYP